MPLRSDQTAWTEAEDAYLAALTARDGLLAPEATRLINARFGNGRNVTAIRNRRAKLGLRVAPTGTGQRGVRQPEPVVPEQEVKRTETESGTEARSYGQRIKTVADLLAHIGADLTTFEVEKSEATKNEVVARDEKGKLRTVEYHRVFVRLRPKLGPSAEELVRAVVAGTMRPRRPVEASYPVRQEFNVLQAVVIADPHFGKYAWGRETGGKPYDLAIASDLVRNAGAALLADGNRRGVGRRAFWLLGDWFHYDTPSGQTTGGTALDRDGRVEKMMEEGAGVLCDLIEHSATHCPTDVVLVPGNHDAVLTVALRQILTAHFRHDGRVTVDAGSTTRKYVEWGKCLVGLTHGDKAKPRLGELMAAEAAEAWGRTTYREIHTGHLHALADTQTVAGVVVRTAPALCPPDGWHSQEGYVGSARGMQTFYYHRTGALVGMAMSNPDSDVR